MIGVFFFFKQKTAYEMRISDWSSDVCSSDLIMDTALVLQVREALLLVEADLAELDSILDALAERYRDTPMAGRTHLQHALPVTFGYKAAVWLLMVRRHRERLIQLRPRALVGQFGGAAGTLASLGEQGLVVHEALMRD